MDWIIEGLRTISGSIDVALMWLAKQVFNVFSAICKVDLLSNGELQKFTARIYVLLGVIMLIKLSMTVFKYLISPDDMSDKSKGFGKLIQNVVIALLLIVSVPTLYNFAMKIQTTVINSNVIGNFILGTTSSKTSTKTDSTNENDDKMGESSDKIIYSVYSTFMSPRLDLSTATSCKKTSIVSVNETYRNECENSGNSGFSATKVFEGLKTAGGETITTDYLIKQGGASILHCDCASELANSAESDGAAAVKAYMRATYIGGIEGIKSLVYGEMSGTGNNATRGVAPINVELKSGEYSYLFSYMWGISWAAAIFLTYIFFCFCIDVGIRVIKLAFLVIIAPIPILSLVDPYKKGEMFNQWTKMLGFTYADVFIRYGSVFFIIYVLSLMPNIIGTLFSTGAGAFATLFIIFGALLFAKQLPDIISTLIPGMKEFGGKGLNPLKRLGEAPILGRGVKALGAGAAAGIGAYNANRWARSDGKKLLKEQNRLDKKRGVDPATRKANLKRGMKDLKNDNKLLSGTGSSMKNAFDDVRGNQTIFGGEKKSTLAKNRAERRKATNEQLQKMRDGYKKENKANKILARGEAAAASAETSAKMAAATAAFGGEAALAKYAKDQYDDQISAQQAIIADRTATVDAKAAARTELAKIQSKGVEGVKSEIVSGVTSKSNDPNAKGYLDAAAASTVEQYSQGKGSGKAFESYQESAKEIEKKYGSDSSPEAQEKKKAELKKLNEETRATLTKTIVEDSEASVKKAKLVGEYGTAVYSKEYSDQIIKVKTAKEARDSAGSSYQVALTAVQSGSTTINGHDYGTAEAAAMEVDKLRIKSEKASGDFKQMNDDLSAMEVSYPTDAVNYKIYESKKDSRDKAIRVMAGGNITPATTPATIENFDASNAHEVTQHNVDSTSGESSRHVLQDNGQKMLPPGPTVDIHDESNLNPGSTGNDKK